MDMEDENESLREEIRVLRQIVGAEILRFWEVDGEVDGEVEFVEVDIGIPTSVLEDSEDPKDKELISIQTPGEREAKSMGITEDKKSGSINPPEEEEGSTSNDYLPSEEDKNHERYSQLE